VQLARTMLAGWIGLCGAGCFAQTNNAAAASAAAADTPSMKAMEFDAVSVRQNKANINISYDKTPQDGYAVEHMALRAVISSAYGIRWDLISGGPPWMDSSFYDIQAKVAGEDVAAYRKLTKQQRQSMMQAVLIDRFKLAAHVEVKELPGYELVVAKNGPKLKDSTEKRESYGANMGDIFTDGMRISTLAKLLSQQLQRTVTDKTGLTGLYDFKLAWDQGQKTHVSPAAGDSTEASEPSPSLFTAVEEELGLKLNATKGPVDTLVIDHVEQPSEN
jgi:uncharacterized protein (TIGR03435 family)